MPLYQERWREKQSLLKPKGYIRCRYVFTDIICTAGHHLTLPNSLNDWLWPSSQSLRQSVYPIRAASVSSVTSGRKRGKRADNARRTYAMEIYSATTDRHSQFLFTSVDPRTLADLSEQWRGTSRPAPKTWYPPCCVECALPNRLSGSTTHGHKRKVGCGQLNAVKPLGSWRQNDACVQKLKSRTSRESRRNSYFAWSNHEWCMGLRLPVNILPKANPRPKLTPSFISPRWMDSVAEKCHSQHRMMWTKMSIWMKVYRAICTAWW